MTNEFVGEKIEKLESIFLNMIYLNDEERIITPSVNLLDDLKSILNEIFTENKCKNIIYTQNTDKQFFGIRINPKMSPSDAIVILTTDEENIRLNEYDVEFDSKLFELGLDSEELAAVTIYEISSMMDSTDIFEKIRNLIDKKIVTSEDILDIRNSVNSTQLIIFAIKDTMYKLSSLMFKEDEDELTCNTAIQVANLSNSIITAKEKIISSVSGIGESLRSPKTIILDWMFLMYRNMQINSGIITDTMKDAKDFTASKLEIQELDKVINAVNRIESNITLEKFETLPKFFERKNVSVVNEISLFKNLKKNGLRGIENELYEFSMRVKNCTESEDAYMIMRGINSRLGILEDYLANENSMSESERKHWEYVAMQYRDLRVKLSSKKFKEKQYGLFFDYSALDNLDKKSEEE